MKDPETVIKTLHTEIENVLLEASVIIQEWFLMTWDDPKKTFYTEVMFNNRRFMLSIYNKLLKLAAAGIVTTVSALIEATQIFLMDLEVLDISRHWVLRN